MTRRTYKKVSGCAVTKEDELKRKRRTAVTINATEIKMGQALLTLCKGLNGYSNPVRTISIDMLFKDFSASKSIVSDTIMRMPVSDKYAKIDFASG